VSDNATTAIVVGASSGLGRALATELAARGHALLLVASDRRDLDALGASLNLAHGIAVRALALDLGREADPGARIVSALDGMPPASALLLPIGQSREDDDLSHGHSSLVLRWYPRGLARFRPRRGNRRGARRVVEPGYLASRRPQCLAPSLRTVAMRSSATWSAARAVEIPSFFEVSKTRVRLR